jgi:hypothetical protein
MKPIAESSPRGGFDAGATRAEPPLSSREANPSSPWISALGHFGEISEQLQTLFALRLERRKLMVRRWVRTAVIVALLATAVVPLILAGVSLFVIGLAQGLRELFGGLEWLGNLTAGGVVLGGVALLAWAYSSHVSKKALARKVAKYGELPAEDIKAE